MTSLLILVNILLLTFSCDCPDSKPKVKKAKKKPEVNSIESWSNRHSDSEHSYADK